jgi:uncharacterized membrane protein
VSRPTLQRVLYLLLGAGIGVCSLILSEKSAGSLACPTSGCKVVQSSGYTHVFGQPLALIGLLGYLAIGCALLIPGWRGRVAATGLAVGGALFALYLVGLQLFVIDAVCMWCVVSDAFTVSIAALLCVRLVRQRDAV